MSDAKHKHTPEPWEIDWFICRMDRNDVAYAIKEGKSNAKVGDELWRVPRSIGPIGIEHNHWAGWYLTVKPDDAYLIAAAPKLLHAANEALNVLLGCCVSAGGVNDRKAILDCQMLLRAAIGKATGGGAQ